MKWIKYAVRDAQGRYWTGSRSRPFSAEKCPRVWSHKRYALNRISILNYWKDRKSWYQLRLRPESFPLELITVEVSFGEAGQA